MTLLLQEQERVFDRNTHSVVLTLLVRLIAKSTIVKPRGALKYLRTMRYYGVNEHYVLTVLGRILGALARHGLAKRLNNRRPRHYLIREGTADRILTYRFACMRGGYCPYMNHSCVIRQALKEVLKQ